MHQHTELVAAGVFVLVLASLLRKGDARCGHDDATFAMGAGIYPGGLRLLL